MYNQFVYTLMGLLPPLLDASPEALQARNAAAIAKVAALLPVGSNEIDLAVHCVAARAQAEAMLRLVRENADDVALVIRLNARYGSMVRTSLAVHGRLMRVQAVRQKREAIEGAANQDARALHIAEQLMLTVAAPRAGRVAAAGGADRAGADGVSLNGTKSHSVASETIVSQRAANGSDAGVLDRVLRADRADPRLANWDLPANGRDRPGRTH